MLPLCSSRAPLRPWSHRESQVAAVTADPPVPTLSRAFLLSPARSQVCKIATRLLLVLQADSLLGFHPFRQPPPLYEASTPPLLPGGQEQDYLSVRPTRRKSGVNTLPNTPAFPTHTKAPSASFAPSFAFPPKEAPSSQSQSPIPAFEVPPGSSGPLHKPRRAVSPPQPEALSAQSGSLNPVSRILSETSANGTSRTSSEFYSISNGSSDTAVSELPAQQTSRLLSKPNARRNPSNTSTRRADYGRHPETLMMGYAKTMGSFTLDGSLVNQAPFEEVKRKGVVGGQGGGGVVGVERSKRESGLFGAFGWGNIGESLGGLLGGGEMSSIKEMRGLANTKTIPLLSTPQSILFVDLRLEPGQSRSYTYRFQLPRGLPPSYKGRAIKVQYHLTIGVQRSGRLTEQQVKHVDVPFRVLGSVNSTCSHQLSIYQYFLTLTSLRPRRDAWP